MKPRRKISKKVLMYSVPAALIIALALGMRSSPLPVDVAPVSRGPLRVTLDEEGETRVRDRFVVSAPFTGRILRIELEPGEPVRTGGVVAVLRPAAPDLLDARSRAASEARVRTAEAALGRARADRERARAELRFAKADLGRSEALGKQGIVSREEVEVAQLGVETREESLKAAEFEVQVAQNELAAARASLLEGGEGAGGGAYEVRSPVDGAVLRRLRESETVVPVGEPLLEIGDPRNLEIVADLLSTDAARLRPGQPVEIEQWGGGTVLPGRVRRIEPSGFLKISALGVEEQRVNVIIDLAAPPEQRASLGDGFRVEVRVVVWESPDALQVPTSALFRDEQGWAAFVLENGKAMRRRVEVGPQNDRAAVVLGGLEEGEKVIIHPGAEIQDGVEVEERGKG
ncbi:MAG TPA: efflux RND transporter periplasmic adaptor subunit [Thermoanaerobaculia bacterium]|nr:efflux RND transporter periplasmic adaptor subunit [Thermoanaerobaculia bacterium]